MTIPTRPAPAPPQMRSYNTTNASTAAADANASLEQLRLQLQKQHQEQQKITIKLPPPPKGSLSSTTFPTKVNNNNNYNNSNNNINGGGESSSSITRKFPKARYAPATNWDDAPFGLMSTPASTTVNGNAKKAPPPRPPPPKVLINGHSKTTGGSSSSGSSSILTNIFHRKKVTTSTTTNRRTNAKEISAARIYGVSSGKHSVTSSSNTQATNDSLAFTNSDWNSAWNASKNAYASSYSSSTLTSTNTTTTSSSQNLQEGQLISFDSPPSSPTFTQKSNSDCVSVDSFSSDSNFSSPQNGSVSQPESGFEDDFSAASSRSRPATTSPLDPWETFDGFRSGNGNGATNNYEMTYCSTAATIGTAPVRNLNTLNMCPNVLDNPLCNGKSLLPPPPSLNMPTIIKPKISQKPKAPKPPTPMLDFVKAQQQQYQMRGENNTDLPTPPSPPMPQCAPPPPPPALQNISILDVISGKADALQLGSGGGYDSRNNALDAMDETPYGIALYDFEGTEEGDLTFRENEKIYLLEKVSDEWFRGRTRAGCEGILPSNYIDIKVPLSSSSSLKAALTTASASYSSNQHKMPQVRCLYNFPAEVGGDLALKENDLVTIFYRINEDWLFGEANDGRQGQFPANFLEYVPSNISLP